MRLFLFFFIVLVIGILYGNNKRIICGGGEKNKKLGCFKDIKAPPYVQMMKYEHIKSDSMTPRK